MKKNTKIPSWNVWTWSFSLDRLETYDVVPLLQRALKAMPKRERPQSRDELSEVLHSEVMYYFWAKCEWEMIIHAWPERDNDKKVDVYDQLCLNWDTFVDWYWEKVYQPTFMKPAKAKKAEKK